MPLPVPECNVPDEKRKGAAFVAIGTFVCWLKTRHGQLCSFDPDYLHVLHLIPLQIPWHADAAA